VLLDTETTGHVRPEDIRHVLYGGNGVGNIVLNLQALESLLRGFLVEKYGQCAAFPKMGDTVACRTISRMIEFPWGI
jgi:hypothetical protein